MMRSNKYRWLFVSFAALATLSLSTPLTSKQAKAAEVETVQNSNKTQISSKSTNGDAQEKNEVASTEVTQKEKTAQVSETTDEKTTPTEEKSIQEKTSAKAQTTSLKAISATNKEKSSTTNVANTQEKNEVNISDPNASESAKQLYGYLDSYKNSDKIMFGQQHATDAGISLKDSDKEPGKTNSDTKSLVKDNPAVIGWDAYLGTTGQEKPGNVDDLAKSMNAVHDEGSIIVLSMHPDNFVTGGKYNDTKGNVVQNILPGGTANKKYTDWLDKMVDLSGKLKDKDGKQYSVIFRPFHEQTGSWFWWGSATTSVDQFKSVFRYTVDYLRDHNVHNFLYAYTPGGNLSGDKDRYLKWYPGDNYVDVFGIDTYDTVAPIGSEKWMDGMTKDVAMVSQVAQEKNKIPVLSEYGVHLNETGTEGEGWYTNVLNHLEADKDAKKIAYMFTWANFGYPDNVYTPYKGYHDQKVVQDFENFANDPRVVLTNGAKFDEYAAKHQDLKVIPTKDATVTSMSPTDGQIVTASQLPITVRVDNGKAAKVVFKLGDDSIQLTADGNYYTGKVNISEKLDKSVQNATVTAYDVNGKALGTSNMQLFIKFAKKAVTTPVSEIKSNASNIKSNGSWSHDVNDIAITTTTDKAGNLAVKLNKKFADGDSWQELKFKTINTNVDDLKKANVVKISGYLPDTSGSVEAYVLKSDQDPWPKQESGTDDLSSLKEVTYNGKKYRQFTTTVTLPNPINNESAPQKSIQFGIVGKGIKDFNELILTKVELANEAKPVDKNGNVVDKFNYDDYLGSDTLLNSAYASNGDSADLHLIKNSDGTYSAEYTYDIGANGYAGRGKAFETPKNWVGNKGVVINLTNTSHPGDDFDLQTQMNGVTFEAHVDLGKAHNGQLYVPFTEFAPASWDTKNKGKKIDDSSLKSVESFWLYINSKVQGKRSITVGDIEAVKDKPTEKIPDDSHNSGNDNQNTDNTNKPSNPNKDDENNISNPSDEITVDNNSNEVVTSNPTNSVDTNSSLTTSTSDQSGQEKISKTIILTRNAYVYDGQGKAVKVNGAPQIYKFGKTITALNKGKLVTINGRKYYQIGKNRFIRATNTIPSKNVKMSRNAFVYTREGKLFKKGHKPVLLRKRKTIRAWNNGAIVKIKGKRFYQIGVNQYVKVVNTKQK